jgi:hypothetical protein
MNYSMVIIGVLIIVILYLLYLYLFDTSNELKDFVKIDKQVSVDVNSPSSTRYAYGIWIYVGEWNSSAIKTIYSHGDDGQGNMNGGELYLEQLTPTLKYKDTNGNEVSITDNFPIQKWTHILVSVDNNIGDFYLDGKLVRSADMGTGATPSASNVSLGAISNTHIAKFTRWTTPINPQAAYDVYMKGNGQTGMLPAYGIDISVFKDNIEQSKFKLF